MNVDLVEAGFAIASEGDFEAVKEVSKLAKSTVVCSLARANKSDIERAKEALSLIDNLDRSKHVLESDDKLKESEALKKTLEHLDIIKKDLISIFEKNNIKQIDSLNKKLDPNFHQAMMEIEDDTKEPGTIIQEIQKGFTIKDRLLRPSLVGVSKKVTIKEEKTEENQENPENK